MRSLSGRFGGRLPVGQDGGLDIGENADYTNHVGILNPFRYRGYYFDSETGLYFLHARYYDPTVCRFISRDDFSYLDPDTVNGINLFAYCLNNPVMLQDPYGHDSKGFWQAVKNFINNVVTCFSNTFGAFVDLSYNVMDEREDFILFGYEVGATITKVFGDNTKPISFFARKASDWRRIWEYQVGMGIDIGKFSYSFSFGIAEIKQSIGWDGTKVEVVGGLDKVGIGVSHTQLETTTYEQWYIRTIPLLLAVATVYAIPATAGVLIPIAASGLVYT